MYDHLGFFHYQTTYFVRMMYCKHNLHTEKLAVYDHLGLFHYQTTYFVRMMYCKHNLHTEKLAGAENKQAGRRLIGKERGGNWVRMNTTQEESHSGGTAVGVYATVTLLSTLMSQTLVTIATSDSSVTEVYLIVQ